MNDHELDLALADFGTTRVQEAAPPALRERLQATVLEPSGVRGWWPPSVWRYQSTFSAAKFVATGVIVALFGGFLLAGVFTTQQGHEVVPAAVTASATPVTEPEEATQSPGPQPSPPPAIESLSGMAIEEIEPGIHRVVNDGVRDLTAANNIDIVAGGDGGIWVLRKNRFFRLGDDQSRRWHNDDRDRSRYGSNEFEVAPDGTVWAAIGPKQPELVLGSFDGQRWTIHEPLPGHGYVLHVEVTPEGTVWTSWNAQGDGIGARYVMGTLGPDGWQVIDRPPSSGQFVMPDSGDPILVGRFDLDGPLAKRYADGEWLDLPSAEPAYAAVQRFLTRGGYSFVSVGPDSTVWAVLFDRQGEPPGHQDETYIMRLDSSGWQEWGPADELPAMTGMGELEVAPDGGLWIHGSVARTDGPDTDDPYFSCAKGSGGYGVSRFDGERWGRYLPDHCVLRMDVADDGSIWLMALEEGDSDAGGPLSVYVVTPEAVAAAGSRSPEAAEPSARPAPTMADEWLAGFLTEDVEPGVLRVVNDGVRDLASANNWDVVAGEDGSIWLLRKSRLMRLGDAQTHKWPDDRKWKDRIPSAGVAPDGTVWASLDIKDQQVRLLHSYDGTRWSVHRPPQEGTYASHVDVAPDGTVWVNAFGDSVSTLGSEGWRAVESPEGLVESYGWVLADDGDPIVGGFDEDLRGFSAKRYHDGAWQDWRSYRLGDTDKVDELDGAGGDAAFVGPDGTMWAVIKDHRTEPPTVHFKRLGAEETQAWVWERGEGVPYPGSPAAVAPDGSLWIPTYPSDCAGVIHFCGDTWSHHLPGRCVHEMNITADGSVWVLAADSEDRGPDEMEPRNLYVITPEADSPTD